MTTSTHARRALALIVLAAIAFAPPAAAQSHRARLSRDLADRLQQRIEAPAGIIVSGSDVIVDRIAARYGVRLKKRLTGGAVFEATGGQIDAISQDPDVEHVSGNATVYRMMAVTTEATGADQVWSGLADLPGFDGGGITVAVIDSGVANHSALRNRIVVSKDFIDGPGSTGDDFGHGTHVAGIIAENGRDGYGGMAPGVRIANLRVLGPDGSGTTDTVIEAIDWAIANRARYGIRVINLSLGHPVFESYRDDPLCQAAQRAVDAGIVVVAAAGNFGKTADGRPVVGGIVAPGNTPAVLTVGALNTRATAKRSDDVMATYSSRGPTAIDGVLKPEVVAPGNRVVAAAAAGSYLTTTFPERVVPGRGQGDYLELSGTSMSAAVVSGAAALVLSARPDLTPVQVKAALQLTASRIAGAGLIEAGAGSVNVAAAVELVEGHSPTASAVNIAGEATLPATITFVNAPLSDGTALTSRIIVWGDCDAASKTTYSAGIIWTSADSMTSNSAASALGWDNLVLSDIIVWGDTLATSDPVSALIIVWGDAILLPDTMTSDD